MYRCSGSLGSGWGDEEGGRWGGGFEPQSGGGRAQRDSIERVFFGGAQRGWGCRGRGKEGGGGIGSKGL